jgi:predicted Zn-dependent protease
MRVLIRKPKVIYLAVAYLAIWQLASACSHDDTKKQVSSVPGDDQTLTPEDEYKLGRKVAGRILGAYPPIKGDFNRYSTVLAQYLAAFSVRPTTFKGYRVQAINCPEIAALSTPGGFIFLSKPLIAAIKSEDEIAGVIAHEVAHIALRHGEMALRLSLEAKKDRKDKEELTGIAINVANAAVSFGGGGDNLRDLKKNKKVLTEAAGDLTETLHVSSYNNEQEFAADKMAVNLLLRGGYDPKKYSEFLSRNFATLDRLKNSNKSPIRMFETHPMDETRVSRINEIIKGWEPGPASKRREKRFELLRKQIIRR